MENEGIWRLIAKKLAGEANQYELDQLEEILRENPGLHYTLENVTDIWNLPPKSGRESEEAFQHLVVRLKEDGVEWPAEQDNKDAGFIKDISRKKLVLPVIGVLALLFFSYVFTSSPHEKSSAFDPHATNQNSPNVISTRYGSKSKINLPDGSTVWLNSGSELVYDKNFGNGKRELTLTGEAFFDVVHDASQPFIIHTEEVDIKVTGTAFNVKSFPSEHRTETSLIRGSLEVALKNRSDQKIILKPEDKLVVVNEKMERESPGEKELKVEKEPIISLKKVSHFRREDSIIVETAWVQHKIAFDDETFKNIAEIMERWYGVEIIFEDLEKEQLRFTGLIENETIDQVLQALSINDEFHFTIVGSKVFIGK